MDLQLSEQLFGLAEIDERLPHTNTSANGTKSDLLQLRFDVVAYDLANEILGAEQAHLDNLRELLDSPKSETGHQSVDCQDPTDNVVTAV